jgi:putative transposase
MDNMMTTINRSFKIRAYPTREQERLFARTEGSCRYVYNRALRELSEACRNGEKKSVIDMSREVTKWKKEEATAWLAEIPSGPLTQSLRDLEKAYANFFARRAAYPKPHRKLYGCSIRMQIDQRSGVAANAWREQRAILPGFGEIKLAQPERIPVERAKMVTLRRDGAGRFFIAFGVEQEAEALPATLAAVGVDLGVKTLATLSTGEKVEAAKKLKKLQRRLKHQQRTLSRRKGARKGETRSRRYIKQKARVARIQCRIADTRADGIHKLTDKLTREFDVVALEDLNVKGMMASAKGTAGEPGKKVAQKAGLNRGIASAGFAEIRRQVEYKAVWRGRQVIYANRWAASSKTCSCCGHRLKELRLGARAWDCPACGAAHDRDGNASINILAFAAAGGEPVDARGGRNKPTEPTVRKATKASNEARTERGHADPRTDREAA